MAVGIVSLLDWPMLTWSLGWMGDLCARPPKISLARLAITSLTFMLGWCLTRSGTHRRGAVVEGTSVISSADLGDGVGFPFR